MFISSVKHTEVRLEMKTLFIKDIGEVTIRKSQKAKRISIRITAGKNVQVILPPWAPYRLGKAFAQKKKDWIIKHINGSGSSSMRKIIFNENSNFKTWSHELRISREVQNKVSFQISSGVVEVKIPEDFKIESQDVQSMIRMVLIKTLQMEATNYLPGRLKAISEKFDLKYEKLTIKNQKTLWGSCSSKNNINLNINLMRLPAHLIDYVLLHELVHTKHKNHGPGFWKTLNLYSGNAKKLARELKNHSIQLLEPIS